MCGWRAEAPVSFEDVSTASFRIRDGIQQTSCKYSPTLSKRMGFEIFLKKDYRQMTGRYGAPHAIPVDTDAV